MKAWAVITVARQVDGEYCIVKVDKAFDSAKLAGDYASSLATKYAETIQTPAGPIKCVCERGVFELEIEGKAP